MQVAPNQLNEPSEVFHLYGVIIFIACLENVNPNLERMKKSLGF